MLGLLSRLVAILGLLPRSGLVLRESPRPRHASALPGLASDAFMKSKTFDLTWVRGLMPRGLLRGVPLWLRGGVFERARAPR